MITGVLARIREAAIRLSGGLFGGRGDHDFEQELTTHLAQMEEEFIRRGHAPEEAARLARVRAGKSTHVLEMMREQRAFPALSTYWLDIKLGLRMLVKYPGLALAGGAGIAVAVALAAGGYSVVYGTYLATSLPLDEGDRLVSIEIWDAAAVQPEQRILYDNHVWRDALKSVQELSAFRILTPNLIAPGVRPESVRVAAMSASGFQVARVRPLMGRYFEAEDERESMRSVLVIGETVWRNRFASDPAILGRIVQLGAVPHTIIGVMPRGFAFPINDQLWVPLRLESSAPEPLTGPGLMVFGRLSPGATLDTAQAELTALGQRTAQLFPKSYATLRPEVMPYPRPLVGIRNDDVSGLLVLQGAVFGLLVLVCLNVAILVYTRTAMRQAEIGLRTALGANRGRIVAQLFLEALVLSVVAALAGVVMAALALRQIDSVIQPLATSLPFWMSFQLSPGAVLYSVALSVFAAAIVGIVPALKATRQRVQSGFRVAGTEGMRLGRTWTILIVAQVGFAVALLPPAVSRTWEDARAGFAPVGFAAEEFLSAQLGMESVAGPEETGRFAISQTELMRTLASDPSVSGVTFAMTDPGNESYGRIEVEGGTTLASQMANSEPGSVRFNRVDVNFFRTFEVPILGGRGFGPADPEGGAIVVNQPFAQRVLGSNALGRRIRYVDGGPEALHAEPGRWYEIVGIVPDFPTGASQGMRDTQIKVYHAAAAGQLHPAVVEIRVRGGSPAAFTQRLREIAAATDANLQLRDIRSLEEVLRSEQWISRLTAGVFLAVTLSVLLLSSAGVYSLMAFTVSQRRKEVGIRMALGADWKRIVASIFSRVFLQLGAGAVLGLALGVALDKGSGGNLLRGNATIVLPAVAFAIMSVGFLAALGPTRRSLRIHPTEALREQ
jgi:predicted permease